MVTIEPKLQACLVSVFPTVRESDQHYWEQPEVYLQPGLFGPHYTLYDFSASGELDAEDLNKITVSGTLRYQVRMHI